MVEKLSVVHIKYTLLSIKESYSLGVLIERLTEIKGRLRVKPSISSITDSNLFCPFVYVAIALFRLPLPLTCVILAAAYLLPTF